MSLSVQRKGSTAIKRENSRIAPLVWMQKTWERVKKNWKTHFTCCILCFRDHQIIKHPRRVPQCSSFFPKSRSYEKNSHHRKPLITKQSRIKANTEHGETETSSGKSVGGKNQRAFFILFRLAWWGVLPFRQETPVTKFVNLILQSTKRKICSCLTSFFDQIGFQRRYETYYSGTLNWKFRGRKFRYAQRILAGLLF